MLGGVAFLEMTLGGGSREGLRRWLDEHVVAHGFMAAPEVVREPQAGTARLDPPTRPGFDGVLPVIRAARARVARELSGLVSAGQDDRFMRAAIHSGRVRREGPAWRPRPAPEDALSDIVLSLFAAAILSEPAAYAKRLCVCDACGRVSFDERPTMRRTCAEHAT